MVHLPEILWLGFYHLPYWKSRTNEWFPGILDHPILYIHSFQSTVRCASGISSIQQYQATGRRFWWVAYQESEWRPDQACFVLSYSVGAGPDPWWGRAHWTGETTGRRFVFLLIHSCRWYQFAISDSQGPFAPIWLYGRLWRLAGTWTAPCSFEFTLGLFTFLYNSLIAFCSSSLFLQLLSIVAP